MEKFGLEEFIELTGVGVGRYSIYEISESGVSAGRTDDLDEWSAADQLRALQTSRKFSLAFPCSPKDFATWYDNTRGTNQVSDFSLAEGFLAVLRPKEIITRRNICLPPVPSSKIVAAFKVKTDEGANKTWWGSRMRASDRYGLKCARVSPGRAQQPSYWNPLLVARWLLEKAHLDRGRVLKVMANHFPGYDRETLCVTDTEPLRTTSTHNSWAGLASDPLS